ncbi:acetyl-CoA carboxylase biotin carboxylase subunit family protein [Streptomyces sp. LN549]|uniref:ATP-grasp domain-containing protein n=1 Tax=Streptomyces sp. LN549 TaxID=3112979 RepID=UPI00371F32E6
MSLLILHRNPFEPFPYRSWLSDYTGDIVVLAARDRLRLSGEQIPTGNHGFTHLEMLDDFEDEEQVRGRALKLADEFGVRHVLAFHEGDVTIAAWLREALELAGAWTAEVQPFRDKALMKERLEKAGVEVARYTVPQNAQEALDFAGLHGFPLVLKDRAGYNSIGLRILRDREELRAHTARVLAGAPRDDLILESFVPGRMCHVDGLVAQGRTVLAWPSQYQYDLASYGSDPGARIDLTLDPDDPLTERLLSLTNRVLAALREPGGRMQDFGFHAEIFHTPDDRLVLCEIACRPGGAKVREVFHSMFGFNLGAYAARAPLGLPLPLLEQSLRGGPRPRPQSMAGQVLMMKRPGLLRSVPAVPDELWVEHFWLYGEAGQVIPPASGSSDFLTCAVATAPTRTECERRLRELGARFEAQTEITAAP